VAFLLAKLTRATTAFVQSRCPETEL